MYEQFGTNTTVALSVTRTVGFFGAVTVTWQAEPIEATILDFSPQSGTISLANTQQDASIYITIIDDDLPEEMEVTMYLGHKISTIFDLITAHAPIIK